MAAVATVADAAVAALDVAELSRIECIACMVRVDAGMGIHDLAQTCNDMTRHDMTHLLGE